MNMDNKEKFIQIYKEKIKREGADKFLDYLCSAHSDFFEAPASTRFHGNYKGGLCEHSIHVYECLKAYLDREQVKDVYKMNYTDETIAIVALLHDICKINVYKESTRNKKVNDKWIQVPYYEFEDKLPFGHGEKSVYILQSYFHLTREEAFAIRYHGCLRARGTDFGEAGGHGTRAGRSVVDSGRAGAQQQPEDFGALQTRQVRSEHCEGAGPWSGGSKAGGGFI